jgi:hypothetical protein
MKSAPTDKEQRMTAFIHVFISALLIRFANGLHDRLEGFVLWPANPMTGQSLTCPFRMNPRRVFCSLAHKLRGVINVNDC